MAEHPLHTARVALSCDLVEASEVRALTRAPRWGLVATGRFAVPAAGEYVLATTSDDGVRVAIDGRVVHEDWTWHAPRTHEAVLRLAAGEHELELEYFQIDGAQALRLELIER